VKHLLNLAPSGSLLYISLSLSLSLVYISLSLYTHIHTFVHTYIHTCKDTYIYHDTYSELRTPLSSPGNGKGVQKVFGPNFIKGIGGMIHIPWTRRKWSETKPSSEATGGSSSRTPQQQCNILSSSHGKRNLSPSLQASHGARIEG
jgi:hypothetical protein